MKTILFRGSVLLAALTIFAATLSAQPHRGPRPFHAIEQQKEALGITEEQQAQLDELKAAFRAEVQTLRSQELEHDARREAMHELVQSLKADLKAVLTESQIDQLETFRKEKRAEHKQRFREARSDVKAYMEQHVQPVMRELRQQLEADISTEDKAEIDRLREAVAQHKAERKAAWKAAKAKGERPPRPAKGKRPEHEAVKQMVEKYNAEIEALFAEVEPQAEQWKADIKFILEAHRPEDAPKRHRQHARRGKRGKGQHAHGKPGPDRIFHKARFLLMDPAATPEAPVEALVQTAEVYPNPASDELNLSYELQQTAEVDLQIHTKEGQLQQNLPQGKLKAGAQTARLDISQLRDGAYYLSVLANGQVQVIPFVVAKR